MTHECTCCKAVEALAARVARLEAEARERNTAVHFENNVAGDIGTHVQTTHIDNLTLG